MHKIINKLSEIPNLVFLGYIWMSDKSEPTILNNETHDFSNVDENPFIIEANLFAEKENISVNIKHIDGKYYISIIELNDLPENAEITEKVYLANPALSKTKKLVFKECWQEVEDELCENMKVLKPTWTAFTGFTNGGNENE